MKNLGHIALRINIIFILCLCGNNANSQYLPKILSESTQISLLTSAPWDGAVYTVFGHSALRIKDTEQNIDEVFNYGIFDFDTPNFIWRFATGETDYIVMAVDFESYFFEYHLRGEPVYEQVLNFNQLEKQKIWEFLLNNIKPENRVYRYNEIFNNCTTKLTDIIESTVDGELIYPQNADPKTFRELLSEHTQHIPWLEFGINLIFGSGTDKVTTLKEKMFLPFNQMNTFDNSSIKRNDASAAEPLVFSKKELLVSTNEKHNNSFFPSPLFVGLLLLCLSIIISIYEYSRKKRIVIGKIFDFTLFTITSLTGCVILFLMFTSHPFTYPNWNIVWLNPLTLILAILMLIKSCKKYVYFYQLINSCILAIFLIGLFFIPQKIGIEFIVFILAICVRTWINIIPSLAIKN